MRKKILLCGSNSYIGKNFIKFTAGDFIVDQLDLTTDSWKKFNFLGYDAIIHLAAIVHRPKETNELLYKQVNTILPIEVATKAIEHGVKQFVFMSTMGVWGIDPSLDHPGNISKDSIYEPSLLYATSKYQAEIDLVKLRKSRNFSLSIVRPPLVYGDNCPGNYFRYMKLCAKYLPLFPLMRKNKFSMISIENLCVKLKEIIETNTEGVICPHDPQLLSTTDRIATLAKGYNRFHYQSVFLGFLLKIFYKGFPLKQIRNLFGDLYYDESLDEPIPFSQINYKTIQNKG